MAMRPFSFLHAADLHLDSPYRSLSNINDHLSRELIQGERQAFENLIQLAIEEEVDFVLLAGDIFDSESGSLPAQLRLHKGLERLSENGIPVYMICGNHDPLSKWADTLSFPEGVTRFGAKLEKYRIEKDGHPLAAIYGMSYQTRAVTENIAREYRNVKDAPFAIALLHGTYGSTSQHHNYAPFRMDDLKAAEMDYWALGHIHKREIIHPEHPLAIYPGNIQGRHFNEEGPKGCYIVNVSENGEVEPQFRKLSSIVFQRLNCDLSRVNDTSEFIEAIDQLIQEKKVADESSYLLRITLHGGTPLYKSLGDYSHLKELAEHFNEENPRAPFVWIDAFENDTHPPLNLEERKASSDFLGALIREFDEILEEDGDEEIKRFVRTAASDLDTTTYREYLEQVLEEHSEKQLLEKAKIQAVSQFLAATQDEQ